MYMYITYVYVDAYRYVIGYNTKNEPMLQQHTHLISQCQLNRVQNLRGLLPNRKKGKEKKQIPNSRPLTYTSHSPDVQLTHFLQLCIIHKCHDLEKMVLVLLILGKFQNSTERWTDCKKHRYRNDGSRGS